MRRLRWGGGEVERGQPASHQGAMQTPWNPLLNSYGPWDKDLHHIEHVYHHNRGEFLVGSYEGRIIAMGAFRKTSEKLAEIKRMRVHPDFQGRGFGQVILDELEVRTLALGYMKLHLDTSVVQVAAQKLYLKNGFRDVSS